MLLEKTGNRYLQEVAKAVGQLHLLSESLIAKEKLPGRTILQRTELKDLEWKAVDKNKEFSVSFIVQARITEQNKED